MFTENGYKVYLVDEYNTSRSCLDGQEMENFRIRKNPRPWKNGTKFVYGLLRSKNVNNNKSKRVQKQVLFNRDLNGSLNIRLKAKLIINKKEIPPWLKRRKYFSCISSIQHPKGLYGDKSK